MSAVKPGTVHNSIDASIDHEPVDAHHQPSSGTATGTVDFGEWSGLAVGIWEMSPGVMSDTEHDELCVVVSGEAVVEFIDPPMPTVALRPRSVLVLSKGMKTRWTVTDTPLRKVYLAP